MILRMKKISVVFLAYMMLAMTGFSAYADSNSTRINAAQINALAEGTEEDDPETKALEEKVLKDISMENITVIKVNSEQDPANQEAAAEDQAEQESAAQEAAEEDQAEQDPAAQEDAEEDQTEQDSTAQEDAKEEQTEQNPAVQEDAEEDQTEQNPAVQEEAEKDQIEQEPAIQEAAEEDQKDQDSDGQEATEQDPAKQDQVKQEITQQAPAEQETILQKGYIPAKGSYSVLVDQLTSGKVPVISCDVTSKNHQLLAAFTIKGIEYDYLYVGSKASAVRASSDSYIRGNTDADGNTVFKLQVNGLDVCIPIVLHKANTADFSKAKNWKAWSVVLNSDTLNSKTAGSGKEQKKKHNSSVSTSSAMSTGKSVSLQNTTETKSLSMSDSHPADSDENQRLSSSTSTSTEIIVEYLGSEAEDNKEEENPTLSPADTKSTESDDAYTKDAHEDDKNRKAEEIVQLEDGAYAPDQFSWSGGSGRLKGIECLNLNVTDGNVKATIVFLSGNYGYLRVDDIKYEPISQTERMTAFEIPVPLNKNFLVHGMTTAMTTAHEIEYTLYIGLNEAMNTEMEKLPDLGEIYSGKIIYLENAPNIEGLIYQGTLIPEAAALFRLHFYNGKIALLQIFREGQSEERTQEQMASVQIPSGDIEESEEKNLYTEPVIQYLIVPEGEEVPAGMEKNYIVIQKPFQNLYVSGTSALEFLTENDLTDRLYAVDFEKEDTDLEIIQQAFENGTIRNAGSPEQMDYKLLVKGHCELAVISSEFWQNQELTDSEKETLFTQMTERMSMLYIPVLLDRSCEEETPEAKEDWEILYNLLLQEDSENLQK